MQWHKPCYYFHIRGNEVMPAPGGRIAKWLKVDVVEAEMSHCDVEEVMKRMQRLWTWLVCCALLVAASPVAALAAGGKAANVVVVADTRKLDGILYWWAEMYNESHFFFAIFFSFSFLSIV